MVQTALFVTAILSLLFALIIFMNDTKSVLFRLFFLLGVVSVLWMAVNAVEIGHPLSLSLDSRLEFARLITPLALLTSLTFYLFLRYFTQKRLGVAACVIALPTIIVSTFTFTNLNVYLTKTAEITTGNLYPFYLFALALNLISVFYSLYRKKASGAKAKIQMRYLRLGAITMLAPTIAFGAILPIFSSSSLSNIAPLFAVTFIFFAGIAIVKHGLFDIKLAAIRSAAYILAIISLSAIYYMLAYVVSVALFKGQVTSNVSLSPVNILLALALSFVFQPVKKFFDKITDDIFYRKTYRSEDFFTKFGQILTSTTDLRGLLERASDELATTFKSQQAFFYLYFANGANHHMSAGTKGHITIPLYDAHALDDYIYAHKDEVILTDLLIEEDSHHIQRMLRSHRIALVMPLWHEQKIVGYIMLGDHQSGYYTKRDLIVLSGISSQLVIAIQNALSLHEVRELNATLQQRIDVATKELRSSNAQLKHLDEVKDEFMSMASHQLRTPLTSVKGYISMVIEGDAGHITPQQQKLLMEAFKSSERMVGLIADFLNVSRLQTGKFVIEKTSFDLKEIVRQEVSDLEMISHSHDIKLRLKVEHGHFPVEADEQKMRQVIMNFIDNAIYYSRPKSTIVINLERVNGSAALTVVDTGIGVPMDEQSLLFNKFFRAQNARKARPDGTGVGLYLARRVVSAHNGQIIFSSKEGKGSTFGFRLPLIQQPAVAEKPKEPEPLLANAK